MKFKVPEKKPSRGDAESAKLELYREFFIQFSRRPEGSTFSGEKDIYEICLPALQRLEKRYGSKQYFERFSKRVMPLFSGELKGIYDALSVNGVLDCRAMAGAIEAKVQELSEKFSITGISDPQVDVEFLELFCDLVKEREKTNGPKFLEDFDFLQATKEVIEQLRGLHTVEKFERWHANVKELEIAGRLTKVIREAADKSTVGILRSNVRLEAARNRLIDSDEEYAKAEETYADIAGMSHAEFVERSQQFSKDLLFPDPVTANNLEVCAMSTAHFIRRMDLKMSDDGDAVFDFLSVYKEYERLRKVVTKILGFVDRLGWASGRSIGEGADQGIARFLERWTRSSYARLEVGHKIAASFCLTDVPDGMVESPWEAWSLVVPDGLLGTIARVWIVELEPVFVIGRDGRRMTPTRVEGDMLRCLVRTSAMALSEPDDFRKEKKHAPTARSKNHRHGPPDLAQATFLLSAPIEVDLREHVQAALEDERLGQKHASPKVQFLVRGHPRLQVHGEGRALRKKIWVKPFWKGPEGGRILLRTYRVEESAEKENVVDGSNEPSPRPSG